MTRRHLARLRHLSWHEARWRAGSALRTLVERAQARVSARWDRRHLAGVLSRAAYQACARDIGDGDWLKVQRTLEELIRARPALFVLDPSSARVVRDRVRSRWPGADRHAAARADRLLNGFHDLL